MVMMKYILAAVSVLMTCHLNSAFAPPVVATSRLTTTLFSAPPAVDYEFEMSRNRIIALVHKWMSLWDKNTGDGTDLLDLLSPEGFEFHVTTVEKPMTTIPEILGWYANFPTVVKHVNHLIQSIDVSKIDGKEGVFNVHTTVNAPGIDINNEPVYLSSVHDWEVVDYGGFLPRISRFQSHVIMNDDGSDISFDKARKN